MWWCGAWISENDSDRAARDASGTGRTRSGRRSARATARTELDAIPSSSAREQQAEPVAASGASAWEAWPTEVRCIDNLHLEARAGSMLQILSPDYVVLEGDHATLMILPYGSSVLMGQAGCRAKFLRIRGNPRLFSCTRGSAFRRSRVPRHARVIDTQHRPGIIGESPARPYSPDAVHQVSECTSCALVQTPSGVYRKAPLPSARPTRASIALVRASITTNV